MCGVLENNWHSILVFFGIIFIVMGWPWFPHVGRDWVRVDYPPPQGRVIFWKFIFQQLFFRISFLKILFFSYFFIFLSFGNGLWPSFQMSVKRYKFRKIWHLVFFRLYWKNGLPKWRKKSGCPSRDFQWNATKLNFEFISGHMYGSHEFETTTGGMVINISATDEKNIE